ncbi:ABC transporter ATP-binding protein [Shinella sumterensis]|uniref:ABC transporter ATP-binding protein n=1 Tax=Shinella sumterensis TaxID=1967501 RepID=A0AA50CRD6_9HYPH|nr:ABC transporter ATP-binding protein [Shinella sumterensis]WLS00659.1 ABC transporter ATP-binding protein [Shinella sumterensis]
MTSDAVLQARNIVSGYGQTRIVDGISLSVPNGGGLALLGRNGAGKTTLVCTLAGRLPLKEGSIRLGGVEIGTLSPCQRCRCGIGFVPQERQIFATLSVEENLRIANLGGSWTLERVYELFPRLAERRQNGGGQLSGGEQQMLAIARALMSDPVCLLLDEPFEGLAPVIVDMLLDVLLRLRQEKAMAMIIVEQHARLALEVAEQGIVVERGRLRTGGSRGELLHRWEEIEDMLAVTH